MQLIRNKTRQVSARSISTVVKSVLVSNYHQYFHGKRRNKQEVRCTEKVVCSWDQIKRRFQLLWKRRPMVLWQQKEMILQVTWPWWPKFIYSGSREYLKVLPKNIICRPKNTKWKRREHDNQNTTKQAKQLKFQQKKSNFKIETYKKIQMMLLFTQGFKIMKLSCYVTVLWKSKQRK